MKKQEINNNLFAMRIIGYLALFALLLWSFNQGRDIHNLQEEINSMPHYECKTEETSDRLELRPNSMVTTDYSYNSIGEESVTCEEGVSYIGADFFVNNNNYTSYCIIERDPKEICELRIKIEKGSAE